MDLLRDLLEGFGEAFLTVLGWIADRIFSFRRVAAWLRWMILCALVAFVWAGIATIWQEGPRVRFEPGLVRAQIDYVICTVQAALSSGPQMDAREQRCYRYELSRSFTFQPLIFEVPFQLLFAPNIFRHVLLAAFAFWLALKAASYYLNELYRLPDPLCGEHHLLQAALINPYNLLRVQEGFVPREQQNLPAYLIGGPALVLVHLENAALFEKKDGTPRVVGPMRNDRGPFAWLDGFERLRGIIDLRDQREEFSVKGRSQDGIRLEARNIQTVYSVYRDHQEPTYQHPYPYQDPESIVNLVYRQGRGPWTTAVGVQIRGELLDFFARHPLNEFLSMLEAPEMQRIDAQENDLTVNARKLMGEVVTPPAREPGKIQGYDFVPRPQLTDKFYRSAEERGQARGTQINWVGVGTWHFPAQIILGRHQEAWKITHDNKIKTREVVLNTLRKQQRLIELLRLIQTVPLSTFHKLAENDKLLADDIQLGLLLAYRDQMNLALEDYEREIALANQQLGGTTNAAEQDELKSRINQLTQERTQIQQVLAYLSRFTGRWLGDLVK